MHDDESTGSESSETVGGRARSLANLRPPWRPGASGNPSGLARDGGGAKEYPLRARLRARLAKRRAMDRMIETWVNDAIEAEDGATRARAREQILVRLDPVTDDSAAGRTVLEGIKLELTPGGAALTMARTSSSPGESFVVDEAKESRAGGSGLDSSGVGADDPRIGEAPLEIAPESQGPLGPTASS